MDIMSNKSFKIAYIIILKSFIKMNYSTSLP